MLELRGLRAAEKFVERQVKLGNDVRWEGFDTIVFHRPDIRGSESKHGEYRNGSWGFKNMVTVDETGTWKVDYKNVRRSKRSSSIRT